MSHSEPTLPPTAGRPAPASIPTPVETTSPVMPATAAADQTPGNGSSTTDVAKDRAGDVTDTARQAGGQVVGEAKEQASQVAGEVKNQTRNLVQQGLSEVRNQTGQQQQRLAGTVHSWAKELGAMASASSESGPMTDLVRDASRRSGEIAHWLENHEPKHILGELRNFARRRPGTFLVAAAAAGVLAGRLTRGIAADQSDGSAAGELPVGGTTPALPPGSTGGESSGAMGTAAGAPLSGVTSGTGSAGIGSADAGTGALDAPPAGPAAGTATGTGLGSGIGGPGSAGPGIGPGGTGPGLSAASPTGAVEPPPTTPPSWER